MRLTVQDFSHKSEKQDWLPPRLFSHVEAFEFTSRDEYLKIRTLPIAPRQFRVVELTSSGHYSLTTEFSRNTIVFPISGIFKCSFGSKRTAATFGKAVSFGPIRRKTTVCPNETGVYRSISIISPGQNAIGLLRNGEWNVHRGQVTLASIISFLEYLFDDLKSDAPALSTSRAFAAAESLISEYFNQLISPSTERFGAGIEQLGALVGMTRVRQLPTLPLTLDSTILVASHGHTTLYTVKTLRRRSAGLATVVNSGLQRGVSRQTVQL